MKDCFEKMYIFFPIITFLTITISPLSASISYQQLWMEKSKLWWMPYQDVPDFMICNSPESIEQFIEGKDFLRLYDSAPHPPPAQCPLPTPSTVSKLDRRHTGRLRKRDNLLAREGEVGWAWSQIIRPQESPSLYKSFSPLWQLTCKNIVSVLLTSRPPRCWPRPGLTSSRLETHRWAGNLSPGNQAASYGKRE
jgi:hypothetical protein